MSSLARLPRSRRLGPLLLLLVLLLAACGGGGGATPTPTPAANAPGVALATAFAPSMRNADKVDEVFLRLLLVYQTQGLDAAKQFARDQGVMTSKEEIRLTLVLDSDDPAIVDGTALAVGRLGGRVTATFGNEIEMVIPVQTAMEYGKQGNKPSFFADLADFAHVKDIRRTPLAQPMVVPLAKPSGTAMPRSTDGASEGVAYTGADAWQAAGITGKGVKVGVIDGGFNRYKWVLAGATVNVKSFRADRLIEDPTDDETIHGTACAEIVHEMAPDAELSLVAVETPGEFAMATAYLVGVGVSVISSSLGFDGGSPLDGTGTVAKAVDKARASGVFFVNAAGNSASGSIGSDSDEGHFAATFMDGDSDGFHDFPGAKQANGLVVRLTGDPFSIVLNWDDWKQPARANYALFLYDRAGKEVARGDTDHVRKGKPPVQEIDGKVRAGTYLLKIRKMRSTDPDLPLNIFFQSAQLEMTTPAGSLTSPADARGVVAVAAVNVRTDRGEEFSSRGPTFDGRMKPEIAAPDYVSSRAYGARFYGTSAATPHVAGAAALLLQAFPTMNPDALLTFLNGHAKPPKGLDSGENIVGSGRLFLDAVPQAASHAPAPARTPGAIIASPTPSPRIHP
jgi:subtilisin family serine protease